MANENEVVEEELEDYESDYTGPEMDAAILKVRTPDSVPTEDSNNLITSQAVYNALAEIDVVPISVKLINLGTTWTGSGPYTQVVTITGLTVTPTMMVCLQPTAAQIASLIEDGVTAMLVENNNGTLTVYAIGAAPSSAMTIQCTVEETE